MCPFSMKFGAYSSLYAIALSQAAYAMLPAGWGLQATNSMPPTGYGVIGMLGLAMLLSLIFLALWKLKLSKKK